MEDKMKDFAISLAQMSMLDSKKLKEEVDNEINSSIEEELEEYKAKKQANYEKLMEKMEKDYNKQIFAYEMQSKKAIINEENKILQEIKQEAIKRLKELIQKENYESFLESKIQEGLVVIENNEKTSCGITKKDREKFEGILTQKFKLNLFEIDEKYIGGCILENQEEGIYIDNTIQNLVNEKI